jgi:hypothetical protein
MSREAFAILAILSWAGNTIPRDIAAEKLQQGLRAQGASASGVIRTCVLRP